MEFKDYYQILGVSPDADTKTIKQTYRRLARQFHPDVNPGSQEAEDKFKEINEAYQVLSNEEQRKKYDTLRAQYQQWQQSGGRGQDFNWQNWQTRPEEGVHVRYGTVEDFQDIFGTEDPYSDFFTSIFGQAYGQSAGRQAGAGRTPRPRAGRDVEYEIEVTLEEAYRGTTRLLQIGDRRVEAKVPAGVRTGSRIRLSSQGEPGQNGGPPGDLYLILRVLPNSNFEREGDDLYADIPVDFYTAVAGGEVRVPTFDRDVMLRIPPRTQAGRSFRLRGKGMPRLGQMNESGDLYARVKLVLPENMTDSEVEALRELAANRERETGGAA